MKRRRKNYRELWRAKGFGSFLFNLKLNPLWLRRLAFLWLLVLAVEFFCPIFDCPDENFLPAEPAAQVLARDCSQAIGSGNPLSLVDRPEESDQPTRKLTKSSSGDNVQSIASDKTVHCADECLCHAVAIPSLAFKMPDPYVKPRFVAITYSDALTLALPPPFEPPKSA